MDIKIYSKDKLVASDDVNSKAFDSITMNVTKTGGKFKLKFIAVDNERRRFGFTKTLTGAITDLVSNKSSVDAAINVDKPAVLQKINGMIEVLDDIEQNFDRKPVNGDLVVSDNTTIGLAFNNTILVPTNNWCQQFKLSPFAHVISPAMVKKHFNTTIAAARQRATEYYINFEHLKNQLQVANHKPGYMYLNAKNTSEVYVYAGHGIFTDVNDLNSQRGHLYISFNVKQITDDDLSYGKADYTLADLHTLALQHISDNTLRLDFQDYQDFAKKSRWTNTFELTKNVRSIQLLEIGQCFDTTEKLAIATGDGNINWLFMQDK